MQQFKHALYPESTSYIYMYGSDDPIMICDGDLAAYDWRRKEGLLHMTRQTTVTNHRYPLRYDRVTGLIVNYLGGSNDP